MIATFDFSLRMVSMTTFLLAGCGLYSVDIRCCAEVEEMIDMIDEEFRSITWFA